MFRQTVAAVICVALATSGCASAAGPRLTTGPRVTAGTQAPATDRSVIAEYVQRLPAGSKVRVERTDGSSLRGTLMKATPQGIVVQRNTRMPEAPVELPLAELARVTLETNGSSVGKSIAIGVASGVGATLGVLMILAAIWSD